MRLFCILFLFGLRQGIVVHDNVIFHKTNEITMTRSRWLVTMVIDLKPYDRFIKKLKVDIENAAAIVSFCLVFFSPFSIAITRLGKRELILVLFVRLFGLCLFRFVGFLFLLGSGKGCGL